MPDQVLAGHLVDRLFEGGLAPTNPEEAPHGFKVEATLHREVELIPNYDAVLSNHPSSCETSPTALVRKQGRVVMYLGGLPSYGSRISTLCRPKCTCSDSQ